MLNEEAEQQQEQSQFVPPEKCSLCHTRYDEDEQWIIGFIGVMPLALCEICLNGMIEMVNQIQKEFMVDSDDES